MDKNSRLLSNLIENIEDIKGKLSSIDYDRESIYCIFPKRESRSYINIKNVLESLVVKTVEGRGHDEDIASISNQNKPFLDKHLQFQNLFSSEEYLIEATNLTNMPLKFEFLHSSLTTFQDFLGDILHSVCQISSCQLKQPSKILVKDLLKLKNQYLSIWDLISSLFQEKRCHMDSDVSLTGESKGTKYQVGEIKKSLQVSLKEMSRIKLEIEHYFKCNLIEMQFLKSLHDVDSGESVYSKEKVFESNKGTAHSLMKRVNSSSQDAISNKMNTCSFSLRKQSSNVVLSSPSLIISEAQSYQTESKGKNNNAHNYPSKTDTRNKVGSSFVETPCRDLFHKPIIFPPNFFFVDPTTILLQSQNSAKKINSLPKIYSVDSLNESNTKELTTSGKSFLYQKTNKSEFNKEINHNFKVEKVEEIQPTMSLADEDLFSENKYKSENLTDSCSICLQEKMSSLFDILRSSENSHGEEDIFEAKPLKIERSDSSYYSSLKFNTDKENFAGNVSPLKKSDYISEEHPESKSFKNKTASAEKSNGNISTIKSKVNNEIPFHYGRLKEGYNNDESMTLKEEVIYNNRSQDLKNGSNYVELSPSSLWPVTAEYIQVSKSKKPQKCQSKSSENSIPLSKSFGKSFYSLHLNKKYEQKHLYDGDLLVLENPERSVEQVSSSYTLLNQSYSIFNQEENYKPNDKVNDVQKVHNSQLNSKIPLSQNENLLSSLKKGEELNSKRKPLKDVKKTLAVHYKDYGDSFKATDKNFNREKFDFLKLGGFDDSNNWNSFISIFTSKVGQTAQINHHRMFRKVINTFTSDSLTCKNVFGNVHTLTSNGGPFRLFDINGYPLTDSAGSVLKDPYGKSVVTLDSTGFPKDDIKVFDAAGNSPNDINFDPTQKPKTNSIIIKLTDNFKRPLHLFDKYGRPLTDSCGKLLVNIHGRPLLRFDNFGRPNTDYRGGPLYTDNGYRWSYRTGDSLSSNESLMPKMLSGYLESDSRRNSNENCCLKDKSGDKNTGTFENVELTTTDDKIVPVLNPSKSDIWIKLEKVLQKFPKAKKIEPKASQTSVIINNVTITQNPIEKELLKSIIYHNNIVQQDVNHFNRIHSQPFVNHKTYLDYFQNINSSLIDRRLKEKYKTYCEGKVLDNYCGYKPYSTTPLAFQNSIFVKSACSKCMNFEQPKHIPSKKFLNEQSFNLGKAFTCDTGDLLKNPKAAAFTSYPKHGFKIQESHLTLKNNEYLNNLCNKILKHEINCSTKHPMNTQVSQKIDWTDTSNTEFLSSIGSKYTTGCSNQTESPVNFSDTSKSQSHDVKARNEYYNSYLKEQQPSDYFIRGMEVPNKDKYSSDFYQIKRKKDMEYIRQKSSYSSNEQTKERFQNESALSLPKPMSINIVNKGNKNYEIKVTEMLSKIMNPKLNFGLFGTGKNNEKSNSLYITPKREIDTSSKSKPNTENYSNKLIDKKLTTTEIYKEKNDNSLFRFSSHEIIDITPRTVLNKKASRLQEQIYQSNPNVRKDSFEVQNEESKTITGRTNRTYTYHKVCENNKNHKGQSIKPIMHSQQSSKEHPSNKKDHRIHKHNAINRKYTYPVKKPVSSNRECNLASFFGSPVKYVLNKLDGKRSLKPNKNNISVKKTTLSNSKENIKRAYAATYPTCKTKPINAFKIKTLYDITKSSKKSMLSSTEKAEIKNHKDEPFVNEESRLLAFRSQSCTGLVYQDKDELMCYSGDSQSENRKKVPQDFHLSSTRLKKSMSATSYIPEERPKHKGSILQSTKYEQVKKIPQNGKNSLNPSMTKRKYTSLDNSAKKSSKGQNGSSGRYSKSPLFSSKTKAKEISLFRRVEPEGKYMLKIKR